MRIGASSWYPPNQQVLEELQLLDSFSFYCGYLTHWTADDWDLIRQFGLDPLPVYVPNWLKDPSKQATKAMRYCRLSGLTGSVALDTTIGLSQITKHHDWINQWCLAIGSKKWYPIEHSHYRHSSYSFVWLAKWGEHDEIPKSAEALEYGPYTLRDQSGTVIAKLVSEVADELFPFARFTSMKGQRGNRSLETS